jgi:hypothetical protein
MVMIFTVLLLLLKLLEIYIYSPLPSKQQIKFGHGYGDAREFPYLGTSRVVIWSNRTNKALKLVCVSLSTEPLLTCGEFGFNGENRSPLSEARYLDRCDVPLVPVDLFRFSLHHEQTSVDYTP